MNHPNLVYGLELLPCAIRDGMLYIPHADGNWVSAAKLAPFSLAIIEHWRIEQARQPQPQVVTEDARDGERLDWLENRAHLTKGDGMNPRAARVEFFHAWPGRQASTRAAPTLREAIDAARAATSGSEGEGRG